MKTAFQQLDNTAMAMEFYKTKIKLYDVQGPLRPIKKDELFAEDSPPWATEDQVDFWDHATILWLQAMLRAFGYEKFGKGLTSGNALSYIKRFRTHP